MPAGSTVIELPDAWQAETPRSSGRLSYRVEGQEIIVEQELNQASGFYEKIDYEALRQFIQKSGNAARRPVIISRQVTS
jgi:hypothetical protein